jgi:transposase-like protein
MAKKFHRISPEVREQVLKRVKEEGVSVSQAAKDHGIHETTIYGWLGTGAQGAPSWAEYAKLKRENKMLLELVGEITLKLSESQKKN